MKEQGIMYSAYLKPRRTLPPAVAAKEQKEFFCSDEVSRMMSGKKRLCDCYASGAIFHKQMRLILVI